MLHFQTSRRRRVPNYLQRSEQFRLLTIVMLVGLLLIALGEAVRPENWKWLFAGAGRPVAQEERGDADKQPTGKQSGEEAGAVADGELVRADVEPPAAVDGGFAQRVRPTPEQFNVPPVEDPVAAVDFEILSKVQNDTFIPVRNEEMPAFLHLMGILAGSTDNALRESAQRGITRLQIYSQPAEYRGQLVRIVGLARRALRRELPENELGIRDYYEVWVQPNDSKELVSVYALRLPEYFPLGETIKVPVEFSGFVFKRWVFATPVGVSSAPLLLARSMEGGAGPTAAPAERPLILPPWLLMLLALGVIWFLVRWSLAPKQERRPLIHRPFTPSGEPEEELSDEEIGRRLQALGAVHEDAPAESSAWPAGEFDFNQDAGAPER